MGKFEDNLVFGVFYTSESDNYFLFPGVFQESPYPPPSLSAYNFLRATFISGHVFAPWGK